MRFLTIILTLSFLILGNILFAQDNDDKSKAKVDPGKFSGKAYFQWLNTFDDNAPDNNTFQLKRVYLTWSKKIDDIFSAKVTTDALPHAEEDEGYQVLIKNAYFQAAPEISNVKITIQGGMISTPTISLMNKLTDARWVNNTYISDARYVLSGTSIDTAADLGVSTKIDLFKMVSITGLYTRGEGYKIASETYKGKSIHGLLTVNPIKELYVYGYIRSYDKTADENVSYYGGGLAWKSDLIKIGISYAKPTVDNSEEVTGHLIDAWAHADLKSVTSMPFLLIGRYAFGQYDDIKTTIIAGGAGYKFNKYFRTLAYYEYTTVEDDDESTIYVKCEVKY